MRIPFQFDEFAVVGDWHRNLIYAISCLDVLATHNIRVVLHLGDFLHYGDNQERDAFLDNLNSVCKSNSQILAFIDGNHEDFPYLKQFPFNEDGVAEIRENIFYLPRTHTWEWNDIKFMALGGAPSINKNDLIKGVSWFPDELITQKEYTKAEQESSIDVLLAHDCPKGVSIPELDNSKLPRSWRKELLHTDTQRQRLYNLCEKIRPAYLFHGHYHRDYHSTLTYPLQEGRSNITEVWGKDCDGVEFKYNYKILSLEDILLRRVR